MVIGEVRSKHNLPMFRITLKQKNTSETEGVEETGAKPRDTELGPSCI